MSTTGVMECSKCFHRWNIAVLTEKDKAKEQRILNDLSECPECTSNSGYIVSKRWETKKELGNRE